jgi:hypothetical protein
VGKHDQAYFAQRAAEEAAAAKAATSGAAASVHRELSLRYSLRQILPQREGDDAEVIGQPRKAAELLPAAATGDGSAERRRA